MPKGNYFKSDMDEAKKRARKILAEKAALKTKDKYAKPSIGDKIILALLRKGKKKSGSKGITTDRTKEISSGLSKAGVDQKMRDKLRGKKK